MTEPFDFDKALKAIQSRQAISGKNGVLTPLLRQLTEATLEAELESHIADDVVPNRKNGKSRRTFETSEGRIDLNTPRDRAPNYEKYRWWAYNLNSPCVFARETGPFMDGH